MQKHFTVDRINGFVIHLNPDRPEIPVYLGKAQALDGSHYAVFAYQGDGMLGLLVRSPDDLRQANDKQILRTVMRGAYDQITDTSVEIDFLYDNRHVFGDIYWPNSQNQEARINVGNRISGGAYHSANDEVTKHTPFHSLCWHTGSNATRGTIVRTRLTGVRDNRFGQLAS